MHFLTLSSSLQALQNNFLLATEKGSFLYSLTRCAGSIPLGSFAEVPLHLCFPEGGFLA